ncbi:MAG: biotin/lipoate A/B protein ligase family protein [Solirubrobacteraceae bacterium]
MRVDLVEGPAGGDPVLDVAMAHALLELVASGQRPPVVRCYRPHPTVAFGRRDRFLEGFPDAAAEARRHGFTPVIRGAGGRAAAYHQDCLIFDEVMPAGASTAGIRERFADDASRQAEALRGLAVDARVGEVPGEYCPGQFSVNARGRVKLIGAAERIVRGSWLHSSVVVVESAGPIRLVLTDVYAALGLDWEPETTGAVEDEAPGVGLDDVRRALLDAYAVRYELVPASLGELERARARELLDRHRVDT